MSYVNKLVSQNTRSQAADKELFITTILKLGTIEATCEELEWDINKGYSIAASKDVFTRLIKEGIEVYPDDLFYCLPPKEQSFLNEFIVDFNPVSAAERAGYPLETAASAARKILSKPVVKLIISCRQQELRNLSTVMASSVLAEYAKIAFSDIGDYLEFDNNTVVLKNSNEVDTSLISSVEMTQFGVKLKLYDKKSALDSLAKNLGLVKDRVEHTGADGGPIQMSSATEALRGKLDTIMNRANNEQLQAITNAKASDIEADVTEDAKYSPVIDELEAVRAKREDIEEQAITGTDNN